MTARKFDNQNRAQTLETTLDLLDVIDSGEAHSQRGMAERIGVALGLTNALIKRCAAKGLMKAREVPARRIAYYLTPEGFAEKSRLTAEYLSVSLDFFRRARNEYADAFELCRTKGWTRVALYGVGELTEIATLAARESGVKLVAVIDPGRNEDEFHGIKAVQSASGLDADAIVIACTEAPQAAFDALASAHTNLLAPPLLRISRNGHSPENGK